MQKKQRRASATDTDTEVTHTGPEPSPANLTGVPTDPDYDPTKGVRLDDLCICTQRVMFEFGSATIAAEPNDIGRIVGLERGYLPMVEWERTTLTAAASFPEEAEVLAGEHDFDSPETTPNKPRRVFLRRGMA